MILIRIVGQVVILIILQIYLVVLLRFSCRFLNSMNWLWSNEANTKCTSIEFDGLLNMKKHVLPKNQDNFIKG